MLTISAPPSMSVSTSRATAKKVAAMTADAAADEQPAGVCPGDEASQRPQGCAQRKSRRPRYGEAHEYDVAGHVGDEHPSQAEDADCVDDTRVRGEQEQQHR